MSSVLVHVILRFGKCIMVLPGIFCSRSQSTPTYVVQYYLCTPCCSSSSSDRTSPGGPRASGREGTDETTSWSRHHKDGLRRNEDAPPLVSPMERGGPHQSLMRVLDFLPFSSGGKKVRYTSTTVGSTHPIRSDLSSSSTDKWQRVWRPHRTDEGDHSLANAAGDSSC